jgi:hypothetical protein
MHGPGAQLRWRTAATSEPASPRTGCVQTSDSSLELLGECRDTTTTKDTAGRVEDVNLSAP